MPSQFIVLGKCSHVCSLAAIQGQQPPTSNALRWNAVANTRRSSCVGATALASVDSVAAAAASTPVITSPRGAVTNCNVCCRSRPLIDAVLQPSDRIASPTNSSRDDSDNNGLGLCNSCLPLIHKMCWICTRVTTQQYALFTCKLASLSL